MKRSILSLFIIITTLFASNAAWAQAPVVSSVSVPVANTYVIGANLDFTINWGESVTVTGLPQLNITIGATGQTAEYVSGSPGSALLFRYTVQAADLDTDGISIGTLILNAGTIVATDDAAAADLTLNSVGATGSVNVDGVLPTVSSVVPNLSSIADGNVGVGTFTLTITFNEAMNAVVAPVITFPTENPSTTIAFTGGAWSVGNTVYTATYTVTDAGVNTPNVDVRIATAQDAAGNVMAQHNAADNFNIDTQNPTVSSVVPSVSTIADGQVGAAGFNIAITFSEAMNTGVAPVVTFPTEDPSGTIAFASGAWSVGNTVYTATYNVTDAGAVLTNVDVRVETAQDALGNVMAQHNAADNFSIDTQNPSFITVTATPATGTRIIGQTVIVTLTASGGEATLTSGAATVNGVNVAGTFANGGGGSYTYTYTVASGNSDRAAGAIPISLVLNDANGNSTTVNAFTDANTTAIEANPPTVSSVVPNLSTIADGNVGAGNFTLTITFNEAMNVGVAPAITFPIENPSTTIAFTGGVWSGGNEYTATYTVSDAGVNTADVDVRVATAQDASGNVMAQHDAANNFSIDTQNPTVLSVMPSVSTIADPQAGAGGFNIAITFAEPMNTGVAPVVTFPTEDPSGTIAFASGAWSAGNTVYTATYNVTDAGVVLADVDVRVETAQDAIGNVMAQNNAADNFSIEMQNPTINGAFTLSASNTDVDITLSEGAFGIGGAPLTAGDFAIYSFTNPNALGATAVSISDVETILGNPLVGGELSIRLVLSITGIPDGDENFRVGPANGSAVFDAFANPVAAGQRTNIITLNSVPAGSFPILTSVLPNNSNTRLYFIFDKAVDRSTSNNGVLRSKNDPREIWSDESISNFALTNNTDLSTSDGGITWELVTTNTTNRVGNETFDITSNKSIYTKTGNFQIQYITGSTIYQNVILADQTAHSFNTATAIAYDDNADGNIDRVRVTFPDGIDDATVTVGNFSFNGQSPTSFTSGTANDNVIDLNFTTYTGTAVVGNLSYTAGTLRDDARFGIYNGVSGDGNLFTTGSITPTDAAGPVVTAVYTRDTNTNGRIDRIEVNFSEPIVAVGPLNNSDVTVSGYTVSGMSISGSQLLAAITEGGSSDTNIRPNVSVIVSAVEDGAGADNPAYALTQSSDGAAPFGGVNALTTIDDTPALTGTIDDPTGVILVNVGSQTVPAMNNANGTWTLPDNTLTTLSPGSYEVTAILIDAFGNTGFDNTSNELDISAGVAITAPNFNECLGSVYSTFDGPIIFTETDIAGISSGGTVSLLLPEGFEFNTAITPGTGGSSFNDISGVTFSYPSVDRLRITITLGGTSAIDVLSITGLQVRAIGTNAQTNVNMIRSGGTASISTNATSYAVLSSQISAPVLTELSSVSVGGAGINQYATSLRNTVQVSYTLTGAMTPFQNGEILNITGTGSPSVQMIPGTNNGSSFQAYILSGTAIAQAPSVAIINGVSSLSTGIVTSFVPSTPILQPFTLYADPSLDDANWYTALGGPISVDSGGDPQETTADNTELSATTLGIHSYDITVDNTICENQPLRFNVLVFDDLDGNTFANHTFIDRNFVVTQGRDTIFLTQPANHTITVSGTGISGKFQSVNNVDPRYKMYYFDPSLAGLGSHTITFTTTQNIAPFEEVVMTVTFDVLPQTELFFEAPFQHCVSEFPFTLTPDVSFYTASPGNRYTEYLFENYYNSNISYSGGPVPYGNMSFYSYQGNGAIEGLETGPSSGVYQFSFNPETWADINTQSGNSGYAYGTNIITPAGEGYVLYAQRYNYDYSNGNYTIDYDFIEIYGLPSVSLANVNAAYCPEDGSFTLKRNLKYVESFKSQDPNNQYAFWDPTYVTETAQDITNGYFLLKWNGSSYVPYANFTASGTLRNTFDPNDPDQDGNTTELEDGMYQIQYLTESNLTPVSCEGTTFVNFTVNATPAAPTLDAATMSFGGSLNFVNTDEYLLEFCVGQGVGTAIPPFNQEMFVANEVATATIRYYTYDAIDMEYDFLGSIPAGTVGVGMPYGIVMSLSTSQRLAVEETVEFYMTSVVNGCESPYRKVTVKVYDQPDFPVFDDSAWPSEVQTAVGTYQLDYCVPFGGGSVDPDNIVLDDLLPGESYNITRFHFDASVGLPLIQTSNTIIADGPVSINVPVVEAGDYYRYDISKTENINENGSTSSFAGCTGPSLRIINFGREEPTAPTQADFINNTTEFHICQGDNISPTSSISHTFVGASAYVWYEDAGGNFIVGSANDSIFIGQRMEQIYLEQSGFNKNVPGVYTYYVSRISQDIAGRKFVGCESTLTPVTITVHAQETYPSIISDNSANLGVSDFLDLDSDPDVFEYAVCSDQLFSDLTFLASSAYAGSKRFEWYEQGKSTPIFTGPQPNFSQLQLVSKSAGTVVFEVLQVTDFLTDSYGNYFDGCSSVLATINVVISDQDILAVLGASNNSTFCASSPNLPLSLNAGGIDAGTGNVSYSVLSQPANVIIASGSGYPTIDFMGVDGLGNYDNSIAGWHELAGGLAPIDIDPTAGTDYQILGGITTTHEITFTYTDPLTQCVGTQVFNFSIKPIPDITIAYSDILDGDGIYNDDPDFIEFCYDQSSFELRGATTGVYTDLFAKGTGIFSGRGLTTLSTSNSQVIFNPQAAHNQYWNSINATTGVNYPYASASSHVITFDYVDQFSCNRTVTKTIVVNPIPQADAVVGGPQSGKQIKFSEICVDSEITAYVQIIDPLTGVEVLSYAGYSFVWTLPNGANLVSQIGNSVTYDSPITNAQSNKSFTIGVLVTNGSSGCDEFISETHEEQSLPVLNFDNLVNNGVYCAEDTDLPVVMSVDIFTIEFGLINTGVINSVGSNPQNDISDLFYSVASYLSTDLVNPTNTFNGSGNPTIDFDQWHLNAGGETTLSPDGTPMGGAHTVHVITMTYTDEVLNSYENQLSSCTSTAVRTINIYPDPDVSFTVNGVDRLSGSFVGDVTGDVSTAADHFCYDDGLISLEGIFGPLTSGLGFDISTGTGTFSASPGSANQTLTQSAITAVGNNRAVFNPTTAHGTSAFAPRSEHIIRYTYTDQFQCVNYIESMIYINPRPEPLDIDITASTNSIVFDALCLGFTKIAKIDLVGVTDYSTYTFTWNLPTGSTPVSQGLDGAGNPALNYVQFENSNFAFSIGVTVTDNNTGCSVTITEVEEQGYPPVPTFTYVGITENYPDGLDVNFYQDNPLLDNNTLTYLYFGLSNGGPSDVAYIERFDDGMSTFDLSPANFPGLAAGTYTTTLIMQSIKGCDILAAEREITILPVIDLEDPLTGEYNEDFELGMGGWYFEIASENGKSDTRKFSWTRQIMSVGAFNDDITSQYTKINDVGVSVPVDNKNIIVTNAPSYIHANPLTPVGTSYIPGEVSYVYSPAFDIDQFGNPALAFDYIRDFDSNRDGLVVQVTLDDGRSWLTLGDNDINSGINWYTHQGVSAGPGDNVGRAPESGTNGQSVAFADVPYDGVNPVPAWLEARHKISINGQSNDVLVARPIRFRFALSALTNNKINPVSGNIADGFAFDNFRIYNINKVLLVEQFSSTLDPNSEEYEYLVYNGVKQGEVIPIYHALDWNLGEEGLLINYFTDVANTPPNALDPINARNKVDPSTRSTYYGLTDVPSTVIAGTKVDYDIDVNPEDFINAFNALALADPDFTISNIAVMAGTDADEITVNATFDSKVTQTDVEIGFFFAVVEKDKTGINSGTYVGTDVIPYVLRVLLPGPGGDYYRGDLAVGQTFNQSMSWTISGIDDPENLRVIAFAQYYNHPNSSKIGSVEQAAWIDVSGKLNTVTGLEDLLSKDVLEIYPNPADHIVNLRLADAPLKPVFWRMSDQSGREVLIGRIERGIKEITIDTDDLPSGMYIIQIFNDENTWIPKKVIVTH